MNLKHLLDAIEAVQKDIRQLDYLREAFEKNDDPKAGVSYKGNYSVYFPVSEVADMLQRRHDGLHVKLNRLMEAQRAGEITIEGWLNQSQGGKREQERTQ